MAITLQGDNWDGPVTLPDDLFWSDQLAESLVDQVFGVTLTGVPVVEQSTRAAGMRVTLAGSDENGWLTTTEAAALRALFELGAEKYALTMAGSVYWVNLDQPAGGFELRPLKRRNAGVARPAKDNWIPIFHFVTCTAPAAP